MEVSIKAISKDLNHFPSLLHDMEVSIKAISKDLNHFPSLLHDMEVSIKAISKDLNPLRHISSCIWRVCYIYLKNRRVLTFYFHKHEWENMLTYRCKIPPTLKE